MYRRNQINEKEMDNERESISQSLSESLMKDVNDTLNAPARRNLATRDTSLTIPESSFPSLSSGTSLSSGLSGLSTSSSFTSRLSSGVSSNLSSSLSTNLTPQSSDKPRDSLATGMTSSLRSLADTQFKSSFSSREYESALGSSTFMSSLSKSSSLFDSYGTGSKKPTTSPSSSPYSSSSFSSSSPYSSSYSFPAFTSSYTSSSESFKSSYTPLSTTSLLSNCGSSSSGTSGSKSLSSKIGEPKPEYDLVDENYVEETKPVNVKFSEIEVANAGIDSTPVDIEEIKQSLLNYVCAALLKEPNFYSIHDKTRQTIISLCQEVALFDPEFILKVALFTRNELNVRLTANFLLAFSASCHECRPYVRKYYCASVRLPSDWLEVAQLYQSFHDKDLVPNALPSVLRKAMADKFVAFDTYQLGKYNKEKATLAKNKTEQAKDIDDEEKRIYFTLKQMIRKIHLTQPVDAIMCIIGSRYPRTHEDFVKSNLPGQWDPEQAGKRMKLPIPKTWETQVSLNGNKASTWETLLEEKNLPFMAMLRNLRNMIQSNMDTKYHDMVIKRLTNKTQVVNSRQFPFRFFSAYSALSQVKSHAPLIQRYKDALDRAVILATKFNLKPIPGRTLILTSAMLSMDANCTAARGLDKPRTLKEVAILLGLMCNYACEQSDYYTYTSSTSTKEVLAKNDQTILTNMEGILSSLDRSTDTDFPTTFLETLIRDRKLYDNIVILTDCNEELSELPAILSLYRSLVNRDLLFMVVNLGVANINSYFNQPKDVIVNGYSDQILRFLAERGDSSQLVYIDNIDNKYNLDRPIHAGREPVLDKAPKYLTCDGQDVEETIQDDWKTARIFVSSTFQDMHGERDMLVRYVFPELRRRAKSYGINVVEIDLRWGITAHDAENDQSVGICLREVEKCKPFFIGMLGDRYGYCPATYPKTLLDEPAFEWLGSFPEGRSITELEIQHALLVDGPQAASSSFFYFRDNTFMKDIPAKFKDNFSDAKNLDKLEELKDHIRGSGAQIFEGYPCSWGMEVGGTPFVTQLNEFGLAVINDLWQSIVSQFKLNEYQVEATSLNASISKQLNIDNYYNELFIKNRNEAFIGRDVHLGELENAINPKNEGGIVAVVGNSGIGKSSILSAYVKNMSSRLHPTSILLTHFVGASPSTADNITSILFRLCHEMKNRFSLNEEIPRTHTELVKHFKHVLNDVSIRVGANNGQLILIIDALDEISSANNAHSLEWLPEDLPKNVVVVLSVVKNEKSEFHSSVMAKNPKVIVVGSLAILEKSKIIRKHLTTYGKNLSEDPSDNQMQLLTAKKQADVPLYLYVACEELRQFGVFEKVSDFIKQLPHTTDRLITSIFERLENEHSYEMVELSLSALAVCRNGLLESELIGILGTSTIGDFPAISWAKLYHALVPFFTTQSATNDRDSLLKLFHSEMILAIQNRYLKSTLKLRSIHKTLASYFRSICDSKGDSSFESYSVRSLSELPYHYTHAEMWPELKHLLTSIRFVEVKCLSGLTYNLLEDYYAVTDSGVQAKKTIFASNAGYSRQSGKLCQDKQVIAFHKFLLKNSHVISRTPILILQQAINENNDSVVFTSVQKYLKDNQGQSHLPLLRLENKADHQIESEQTILGFRNSVVCLASSPNGQMIATGSKDCDLQIFSASTGQEMFSLVGGHSNSISDLHFPNNKRLVSCSWDGLVILWEVMGKSVFKLATLKKHNRQVSCIAIDPYNKFLLSGGWDCAVNVWNPEDGSHKNTLNNFDKPINCMAIHPDGSDAVFGCWDGTLSLWNLNLMKRDKILRVGRHESSSIRSVNYSREGQYILNARIDGFVDVWSTVSFTRISNFDAHTMPINTCIFSPNGKQLLTSSDDNKIKIWSANVGRESMQFKNKKKGAVRCIATSPDCISVAVGYHEGHLSIFNLENEEEKELQPFDSPVTAVAYSPNKPIMIAGNGNGKLSVFSAVQKKTVRTDFTAKSHKAITSILISGTNVFAASEDFCIYLYTLETGKNVKLGYVRKLVGHTGEVTCVSESQILEYVASVSKDKSLIIWDGPSGKVLHEFPSFHFDWINSCAFGGHDDSLFVTASNDFTLKVSNPRRSFETLFTLTGHTSPVTSCSFLESHIMSSSLDGTVRLWNSKTGAEFTSLRHELTVGCAAPLGEDEIISGTDDGKVTIWRPFESNLIKELKGHSDRVYAIEYVDNKKIFSSSQDRSLRVWPIEDDGQEKVVSLGAHVEEVSSMAYNEEGSYMVTVSLDGTFNVYKLSENGDYQWYSKGGHSSVALTCVLFIDNETFVVGGNSATVRILSVQENTCKRVKDIKSRLNNGDGIQCMTLFKSKIVFGSCQGAIWTYDLSTKTMVKVGKMNIWLFDILEGSQSLNVVGVKKDDRFQDLPDYSLVTSFATEAWNSCGATLKHLTVIGNSEGHLIVSDTTRVIFEDPCHYQKINCVDIAMIDANYFIIVTGSNDRMVRVWTWASKDEQLKQVGEFWLESECTSLKLNKDTLGCGDKLGGIYFLSLKSVILSQSLQKKIQGNHNTIVGHNNDTNRTKVSLSSDSECTLPSDNCSTGKGEHVDKPLLKAGFAYQKYKAKRNCWPQTRGVTMNPLEHPQGEENSNASRKVGLIARN